MLRELSMLTHPDFWLCHSAFGSEVHILGIQTTCGFQDIFFFDAIKSYNNDLLQQRRSAFLLVKVNDILFICLWLEPISVVNWPLIGRSRVHSFTCGWCFSWSFLHFQTVIAARILTWYDIEWRAFNKIRRWIKCRWMRFFWSNLLESCKYFFTSRSIAFCTIKYFTGVINFIVKVYNFVCECSHVTWH